MSGGSTCTEIERPGAPEDARSTLRRGVRWTDRRPGKRPALTHKPIRIRRPDLPTGVAADANDIWVTVRGR